MIAAFGVASNLATRDSGSDNEAKDRFWVEDQLTRRTVKGFERSVK